MTAALYKNLELVQNSQREIGCPSARSAGIVSSAMGCLQTGGAALAGYLVRLFYDHTPLSLGVTVAAFACLTLLAAGVASLQRDARAVESSMA